MANYIKFQRGSQAAYDRLKNQVPSGLDSNTLYFIYQSADDEVGALYMGDKVIATGDIEIGATALSDLTDVSITSTGLSDKVLLSYDATAAKWVPKSANALDLGLNCQVKSVAKTTGQSTDAALSAALTSPSAGDIVFVDNVPYVYNGTAWQGLLGSFDTRLTAAESSISSLQAVVGNLQITSGSRLINSEEIAKLSALVLNDGEIAISGTVNASSVNGLDTFISNSTLATTVGNLSAALSDYATTSGLTAVVGNLSLLTNRSSENSTLVDEINSINERLTWIEMSEE